MGIVDETRFVERFQFFNGQRLLASDLQGVETFNREMRWLHNLSLHQPGIGSGFAVAGKKGAREVQIGPGYAIDAQGREIVLTQAKVEPVPPVAGEGSNKPAFFDLTVSYPGDADLEEAEIRQGICCPPGVVRLREEPVFCWVRLRGEDKNFRPQIPRLEREIREGMRIVLARAEVLDCQLNRDLSVAQRRSARPAKQPYIACGRYEGVWEIISDPNLPSEILRLNAQVSTASAGFLTKPCYAARIDGTRPLKFMIAGTPHYIFDITLYIDESTPSGFNAFALILIIPELKGATPVGTEITAETFKDWHIVWMGIEG